MTDPDHGGPTPSSHLDHPVVVRWDDIAIAAPCAADWDDMTGDDCRRFCGACEKNVYDLTNLTRSEAEETILAGEGRLCVRLYRRPDGTLTPGDCVRPAAPTGRVRRLFARVAAVVIGLSSVAVAGTVVSQVTPESELAAHGTFARKVQDHILDLRVTLGIDPEPVEILMGEIYVPPPPNAPGGAGGQ